MRHQEPTRYVKDLDIAELRGAVQSNPPGHSVRHAALNRIYALQGNTCPPSIARLFRIDKLLRYVRIPSFKRINADLIAYLLGKGFEPDGSGDLKIRSTDRLIIKYGDLDHEHPAMVPLVRCVRAAVAKYRRELGALAMDLGLSNLDEFKLKSFAAATRGNGYHYPHIHSGAVLVMTYYVSVPLPNSGEIAKLSFGSMNDRTMTEIFWIRPMEGYLVTFPGHLAHATTPPMTDELRVSVGFDICAAR